MIIKFAGYGFNKSHSTAYALVAYQTAYLKTHYPVEFMAALLTGDIPDRNFTRKDSLVEHLEDCQRMNIDVVPPSVNSSDVIFSVRDNKIHFAMSAIKGCGSSAAEAIVASRKEDGPFKDLFDFCERIESSQCSRSSIETLIKAGAMDCFGAKRAQLMAMIDRAIQSGASAQADKKSGQKSLFGDDSDAVESANPTIDLPDVPEWEERELLAFEKEVLGFYLTSHPLAQYEEQLTKYCSHVTTGLEGTKDRDRVTLGGMISSVKFSHVKRARDPNAPTKYVMFDLEDVGGSIRCIQWPTEFAVSGDEIKPDAIVLIQGSLDYRGGDEANLIVDKVIPIDQIDQSLTYGIRLIIDQNHHGSDGLKKAYEIIRGYPGSRKLEIELCLEDGMRIQLDSQKKIEISSQLCRRLQELLGKTSMEMLIDKKTLSASAEPSRRRYQKT